LVIKIHQMTIFNRWFKRNSPKLDILADFGV
jgi:hypothetical protein